jgi:predicted O-methyltransferase YrrM
MTCNAAVSAYGWTVIRSIRSLLGIVKPTGEAAPPATPAADPLAALAPLDGGLRARLESMYRQEDQIGGDGLKHPVDAITRISPSQGMWLYEFYLQSRPARSLEVGMAYGFSTLYFLAAMARLGGGHHTAVDPFQTSAWHGIGLAHAKAITSGILPPSAFEFIEDRSDRAAIDFARAARQFDLIFIDGNHRYDDALVDFYLHAPLCAMGGHIVFDDMWMSSIQTVVAYIRANRPDFKAVDSTVGNIAVFRKVAEDQRSWKHFRAFAVAPDSD